MDATRKKSLARRFGWVLSPLAAVLLVAVPFIRPVGFHVGDKSISVSVQSLASNGPFADDGVFIRTGWDGPTGSFSRADTFGVKLGGRLLRLDIVEDPIAAAQRRLPKTVTGLIATLESKDTWRKFCAFRALADMGESAHTALPALIKAVERGDAHEQGALSTVGKAAGSKSVPALMSGLASRDATVRRTVAEILGEIGPEAKAAVPSLKARLQDAEPRVVAQCAFALWKVDRQTHDAVSALVKLLAHVDADTRAGAAAVLGELGSESAEAIPALLRTLDDDNSQVRAMSARSLGMIGPAARPAIPCLIVRLDDASDEVLMWTANALGQFGENAPEAVPKLTEFAAREDGSARWAIEALAEMGTNAVPSLAKLYRSAERGNRHFVAKALMKLGTKASAAVPVVAADLTSESVGRVVMAAQVLGRLGEDARVALPRLMELLTDEDARVRVRAAESIWRLDRQTNAVLPILLGALKDDSIHRAAAKRFAAEVLAEMRPAAQEALIGASNHAFSQEIQRAPVGKLVPTVRR